MEKKDIGVTVLMTPELLARIDAWCSAHTLKPSRAQAIRMFIAAGLPAQSAVDEAQNLGVTQRRQVRS